MASDVKAKTEADQTETEQREGGCDWIKKKEKNLMCKTRQPSPVAPRRKKARRATPKATATENKSDGEEGEDDDGSEASGPST